MQVQDRFEDGSGSRGTIRYIGPVATSKDSSAIYYGIEWDAWDRGLNDGSVTLPSGERVVYFNGPAGRAPSTTGAPMHYKCSFLKQAKAEASSVQKFTLIQRLLERYDPSATGEEQEDPNDSGIPRVGGVTAFGTDVVVAGGVGTTLGSQRPIELVGVNKLRTQQKLTTLEKISLARCQIASLGVTTPGELAALTPQITELDLSFNLINSWDTVFEIIDELPLLETLILTGNRMNYNDDKYASVLTSPEEKRGSRRFDQVKAVVLNQTDLSWSQVTTILGRHFPNLKELYFAANELTDVDMESIDLVNSQDKEGKEWLTNVHTVDLSENKLTSWTTVCSSLGKAMPHVKHLSLNGNQVASLVAASDNTGAVFAELMSLALNDNKIDSWKSIDAMNSYPQLTTIRIMRNPLTAQMGIGETRLIIFARAAFVQVINGSTIRSKERVESEQMYLKRILHELAATGDSLDQQATILASHPRYPQLCELYPEVVATAKAALQGGGVNSGPSTLGSSLVQVKIVPMSMSATTLDPLAKRLPQTMKITQLKMLIEKKFGVLANEQLLSFRMNTKSIPLPLDDDTCELSYYGLQDGAEILINDA